MNSQQSVWEISHFSPIEDVVAVLVLDRGGVDVGAGAAGLLGQGEAGEDGLVLNLSMYWAFSSSEP